MPIANRRAPRRVRRFAVLQTFRYQRRVYEAGDVFAPRGDVPQLRIDRLWREGVIGTLDGESCPEPHGSGREADVPQEPTAAPTDEAEGTEEPPRGKSRRSRRRR